MRRIAVFDMNETTLDLAPMRTAIGTLLGTPRAFELWFARLLQHSMVIGATGRHEPFGTLGAAALAALADAEGVTLPEDAVEQVRVAMAELRPHPDVTEGLDRLAAAGWRLVVLTNSSQESIEAALDANGLASRFEHILSVDAVQRYKPAPAPYLHAAKVVNAPPGEMLMVACHDWDLAGAKAAGMLTAFVTRPGMAFSQAYPPPDITVAAFTELVEASDRLESGR
jgi:2-haloacid dehalogenase